MEARKYYSLFFKDTEQMSIKEGIYLNCADTLHNTKQSQNQVRLTRIPDITLCRRQQLVISHPKSSVQYVSK